MAGLPDKAPDNGLENRKPLRKGTDGGLDKRVASSSNDTLEALAGGGGGGSVLPESSRDTFDSTQWLAQTAADVREGFERKRLLMSFSEYFALFGAAPARHARSAAQYLRDVFDHFGSATIATPRGQVTRWRLFDCAWDQGKDALMGQEEVQAAVYRVISNFAREGRTNRLILLHGPNGSAKSTFVACLQRAMEHYSALEEGALYRFNWIFPAQKLTKGGSAFLAASTTTGQSRRDLCLPGRRSDRGQARGRDAGSSPAADPPGPAARPHRIAPDRTRSPRVFGPPDYLLRGDLSHRNRRYSRPCWVRIMATYRRCCGTCRWNDSSCRAATGKRRPRSSRRWPSTRVPAS